MNSDRNSSQQLPQAPPIFENEQWIITKVKEGERAYIVHCNKRAHIHDMAYFDISVLDDVTQQSIDNIISQLRQKNHEFLGCVTNKHEATNLKRFAMLHASKQYIPYGAEALANKTSRPIMVHITNKSNTALILFPGFYTIKPVDYEILSIIIDIRLATTDDVIDDCHTVLIVTNLSAFSELRLKHLYCVSSESYYKSALPRYEVQSLISCSVIYNMNALAFAIKEMTEGDIFVDQKTVCAYRYFDNDIALLQRLIDFHKQYIDKEQPMLALPEQFPLEIALPTEMTRDFADLITKHQ